MRTTTERPLFPSVGRSWHSVVPPSDLPLKRTMDIRESSFDATTAHNAVFRSDFFWIANRPIDFAPQRASSGPRTSDNANCQSYFFTHGEARAPRHKHVQLEGQFRSLVHILCVWQELQWSWLSAIIFIAGDSHISYLYICHGHIYI